MINFEVKTARHSSRTDDFCPGSGKQPKLGSLAIGSFGDN